MVNHNVKDPDVTRSALLRAAVDEFQKYGLAGARVDRIAREAGVNKRMIYHYFGDKEGMFAHAIATELDVLFSGDHERVEDWVEAVCARMTPSAARLVLWQALEGLPDTGEPSDALSALVALIEAAVADGRMPKDVDAPAFAWCLLGLCVLPDAVSTEPQMGAESTTDSPADSRADSRAGLIAQQVLTAFRTAARTTAKPRIRLQPSRRPAESAPAGSDQ